MNEVILECCGQPESECKCAIEELAQLLYTEDGYSGNVTKSEYLDKYQEKAREKLKEEYGRNY